jgi:hypothetical protein
MQKRHRVWASSNHTEAELRISLAQKAHVKLPLLVILQDLFRTVLNCIELSTYLAFVSEFKNELSTPCGLSYHQSAHHSQENARVLTEQLTKPYGCDCI